jgi:hypothetical protein
MPFKLNARWSLIARTIVPINSVPVGVGARSSGVGDVQEQVFITPSVPGKVIWGVGPMFSLPTATADASRTVSWALSSAPILIANWNAESGQQWTVPFGLGITRTTVFSGRPIQLGIQYYHNVSRPDCSPATQFRMIVTLLYPTKK